MAPQYLYKYRCWGDEYPNHKRLLTHNELFFASAKRFSDPFEFAVSPCFELATPEQELKGLMRLLKERNPTWCTEKVKQEAESILERDTFRNPQNIELFRRQHQQMMYNDFGIYCLAKVRDNILMWSHYAKGHQGFCVGFDYSKLLELFDRYAEDDRLIDDHPVEYCRKHPVLNPYEMDDIRLGQRLLTIKSSDWRYENEHRLILFDSTDEPIILEDGTIVEVIFGCRMSAKNKEEIKDVFRKRPTRVRLFQAKEKSNEFGLDFQEIDY